jgi:hypothetical protein
MVPQYVATCRRVLGRSSIAVSYSAWFILPSSHMRTTRKLPSRGSYEDSYSRRIIFAIGRLFS